MMGFYLISMLLLGVPVTLVMGLSSGAPAEACSTITPSPSSHGPNPQTSAVPYIVNISSLDNGYIPGESYAIILSGTEANADFRGFLVLGSLVSDGSPIGTFTDNGANQQVRCTGNTGITHDNGNDKTMVELTWNAPAVGTGPINFRYAMVDTQMVYWANQTTATVAEVTMDTGTISPSPVMMSTSFAQNVTTTSDDIPAIPTHDTASSSTNDVMTSTSTTPSVTMSPTGSADDDDNGAPGVMAASSVLIMLLAGIITLIN